MALIQTSTPLADLINLLQRLWVATNPPHANVQLGAERTIKTYATALLPYMPDRVTEVIEHFISCGQWPLLSDVTSRLPPPGPPQKQLAAPAPGRTSETWNDRCKRLFPTPELDSIRFARIGVSRWQPLMDRHATLTDAEIVGAVERLDQGRPASDGDDRHVLTDVAGFMESMAILRNYSRHVVGREALLRIGEDIEARHGLAKVAKAIDDTEIVV